MHNIRRQSNLFLLQLIQDPELRLARESVAIKQNVLIDYIKPAGASAAIFKALNPVFAENAEEHFDPEDPVVFRDADGDLAVALPYAERLVLTAPRHFGRALALILMMETCYEPTLGSPARLSESLIRYRPLVKKDPLICDDWIEEEGPFVSASLLHQFLEVDQPLGKWLASRMKRRRRTLPLQTFPDFKSLVREDDSSDGLGKTEITDVLLSPEMAGRIAAATPTIRGRKMKGCLVEPGMRPFDLADNDPKLLELLLKPPTRGLASL